MEWIEEARQMAAQCWCDPKTKNKEMDPVLAEAVAERIAAWMQIAAQNERNTDYYRGLVVRIGKAIGREAYIQDDGGVCEDVLCAKVPELVERMLAESLIDVEQNKQTVCCGSCGKWFEYIPHIERRGTGSELICTDCIAEKYDVATMGDIAKKYGVATMGD